MSANFYRQGSHNFICDKCGQKHKREQGQKEWTGILVCKSCYDPKHPWFEPLPLTIDSQPVPDSRPRPRAISISSSGLETWGSFYFDASGNLNSNVTWEGWNSHWGGEDQVEFNSENFPNN